MPNLARNPRREHLHPLDWGICEDCAPPLHGLLPGHEGE